MTLQNQFWMLNAISHYFRVKNITFSIIWNSKTTRGIEETQYTPHVRYIENSKTENLT